jgi:hypothetical protein
MEEFPIESLESVAPQLCFLLKTRIYLDWLQISESGEEIFWKKLRRALGFTNYGPYGTVKQYYQNYWFKKSSVIDRQRSRLRAITSQESVVETTGLESSGKRVESRDFLVPSICVTPGADEVDESSKPPKVNKNNISSIPGRKRTNPSFETCIRMKDLVRKAREEEEGSSETGSKVSATEDSAISSSGGMTSRTMSTDEDDVDEDEEAVFGDVEDEESTSGCESSSSSLRRDRITRRKMAISLLTEALHANHNNNNSDREMDDMVPCESSKRPKSTGPKVKASIIEEG